MTVHWVLIIQSFWMSFHVFEGIIIKNWLSKAILCSWRSIIMICMPNVYHSPLYSYRHSHSSHIYIRTHYTLTYMHPIPINANINAFKFSMVVASLDTFYINPVVVLKGGVVITQRCINNNNLVWQSLLNANSLAERALTLRSHVISLS